MLPLREPSPSPGFSGHQRDETLKHLLAFLLWASAWFWFYRPSLTGLATLWRTGDLAAALKSGVIGAAGIDVYVKEPPEADFPLLGLDNAICTPHYAWSSIEGAQEIRYMILDDVRRFLKGQAPIGVVNKAVYNNPKLRLKSAKP